MRLFNHQLITRRRALVLCAAAVYVPGLTPVLAAEGGAWSALRQGSAFAVIRHALAPGTGDPENFNLDDCSTQRNLSEAGRQQAIHLGDLFRENGIAEAAVFSSAWCRCVETATLMGIGTPVLQPALNSFFQLRGQEREQTQALTDFLNRRQSAMPLILVTHQVNITALTDVFPGSGEIIFVSKEPANQFKVLGQQLTGY